MAKEEAPAEEAKPNGGSKKLIIIVAIVLVLVLGGAGAFFAMKGFPSNTIRNLHCLSCIRHLLIMIPL